MKKIAIVGTAPDWKRAPFDDEDWEIWACNKLATGLERCDRIFEIHRRFNEDDLESPDKAYLKSLKKETRPVYSIIPLGSKNNVVLDREKMFKKYGKTWFSSSFSYMLALALNMGVKEVGLWGMGMESREEYVVQQAGVRHFVDLMRFVGIKVHIPDYSVFAREPSPYPDRFETNLALVLENKAQLIKKLLDKDRNNLRRIEVLAARLEGRIRYRHGPVGDSDSLEDDYKQLAKIQDNETLLRENVHRLKGELYATQHYKRLFVWNVIPPEPGEETDDDVEDCGPI